MTTALIGVIIGATATLAGAFLQLWFAHRQRERERYMQLRRDVYLAAAEGLASMLDYLAQNARSDVPFGRATAPPGMAGWLLKTYLVASTETLIALNEASALVGASAVDLAIHRLAVQQAEDDMAISRSSIERIQHFMEEMRAEIKAADTEHPTKRTLERVEWAATQHDAAAKQLDQELGKLDALGIEHARRLKNLVQEALVVARDVQKPVREALLAARSELEISLDNAKFASAASAMDARMSLKIQELTELIEEVGTADVRPPVPNDTQ